jgi:hypothetical protein
MMVYIHWNNNTCMVLKRRVLIVGCGGIGSNVVDALYRACHALQLQCIINVMDSDIVSSTNLGHQRFQSTDVGQTKVSVLERRYSEEESPVNVIGIEDDLIDKEQLTGYDFIIVAVDRPEPRRMVHQQEAPWIDLRCSGDGFMVLTYQTNKNLVEAMTPNHPPKSCQLEGALDIGNIEFGFLISAAHGAQWALQHLRGFSGPHESIGSITSGSFQFPVVSQ